MSEATIATIITRGLASSGFTGYVYISLDHLNPNQSPLIAQQGQPYPVIKATSGQSNSMDLNFSEVLLKISKVSALFDSVFDKKTQASLKNIIWDLEKITHVLAVNTKRFNSLIINAEKISGHIDPLLDTGSRALIMAELQIFPEMYQALTRFNNLSGALTHLMSTIDADPSIIIRGIRPSARGPGESH